MSRRITCKSRYNQPRYESKLGAGEYLLEGPANYQRLGGFNPTDADKYGLKENDIHMFDFEGGPALYVGASYSPGKLRRGDDPVSKWVIAELHTVLSKTDGWCAVRIRLIPRPKTT